MGEELPPESSRSEGSKPHVVVFTFPAQGHLLPLLDLTHQLCLRGVTVSVIVTPRNLTYLSPLISAHPSSVSAIVFPFPPHPALPPGVENVKDVGNSGNLPIMASLRQLRHPIILWFRSLPNPPVALISDFFLGWTHDLCNHIGIPRFAFFSISSFLVSVIQFCFENVEQIKSKDPVHLLDLPRSPIFKEEHLPSVVRRCLQTSSPDLETSKDFSMNALSYGSVFNSSECLEYEYLEYVKQRMGHDRFFVIGPLCSIGSGLKSVKDPVDPELLSWLDGSPDGSVLYVCFGSQKALTKDQCDALALGLEKSMTRFVWVVKKDPVPDGFEDRVSGRGILVRGWVPQLLVLRLSSHDSLGILWWLFTSASTSSPAIFSAIRTLPAPATYSSSGGLIVVATRPTTVTRSSKSDKAVVFIMAFITFSEKEISSLNHPIFDIIVK